MSNFKNLEEALTYYDDEAELSLSLPIDVYLAYNECMYPAENYEFPTLEDFVVAVENAYQGKFDSNASFARSYGIDSEEIPERLLPVIDWDAYWNLRLSEVYAVYNGYYFL